MGLRQLEGGVEFDFRDSWRHEVVAYELDKLLGLRLVPPTVERKIDGRDGALQIWVRLGRWLDKSQVTGLLARRDRILAHVKKRVAEKGEDAVLYP